MLLEIDVVVAIEELLGGGGFTFVITFVTTGWDDVADDVNIEADVNDFRLAPALVLSVVRSTPAADMDGTTGDDVEAEAGAIV